MKNKAESEYQILLVEGFKHRILPMIWGLVVILFVFSALNFQVGNQVMFVGDFSISALLALLGWSVYQGILGYRWASNILLFIFSCSVLAVYCLPQSFHGALYNYSVVPFFALYLMGSRLGLRYSIIIWATIFIAYMGALLSLFNVSYSSSETIMFLSLLLSSSFFAWTFERTREQRFINAYNKGLHRESLLNAIDAVYYRADMQGALLEISPAICPMSGYSVDELIGKPISDYYVHPEERAAYLTQLQAAGRVTNYIVMLVKKNGDSLVVSMSSHIVLSDGVATSIEGVFLDVTREQQVEHERQESLNHLRHLSFIETALSAPNFEQSLQQSVEQVLHIYGACRAFLVPVAAASDKQGNRQDGAGFFFTDADGAPPFCPQEFAKDSAVWAGLALRDTDTDTDTDTEFCPIVIDKSSCYSSQTIEKYHIKSHMMIVIRMKSGRDWLLAIHCCDAPVVWTKQQKSLLIDISHRLRSAVGQLILQQDLQLSMQQAEVASKAKGDFLATMSHELRTPLHGVIGLLDLMSIEQDRLSTEQKNNLHLAQSSAHILSSLIDDVLDLSKIESGKVDMQYKAFDVEETLRCALIPFVMKARDKGLELSLDMHGVSTTLFGDALRLRQVLLNLVGNALKFTNKGYVRLDTWQHEGQWHITIEDSGIGIAADKQSTVFSPFVQLHEQEVLGENLQDKGTGLGTTISKHFVEMMGGSLTVKSLLGVGSTFHIYLPLHEASNECKHVQLGIDDLMVKPKHHAVLEIGKKAADKQWSVLLAEDDPVGRKIAVKQLKRVGFQVTAVNDGLAAWSQVREHDFDLLLTDIRMPGMDGMQLTKAIREYELSTSKAPMLIIGLSAHALEEVRAEALAHGMDEFIAKPVDMQALMTKLEDAYVADGV